MCLAEWSLTFAKANDLKVVFLLTSSVVSGFIAMLRDTGWISACLNGNSSDTHEMALEINGTSLSDAQKQYNIQNGKIVPLTQGPRLLSIYFISLIYLSVSFILAVTCTCSRGGQYPDYHTVSVPYRGLWYYRKCTQEARLFIFFLIFWEK